VGKEYSVLMSIYHKENPDFFKVSVESMLNQTLKPEQIVIVKDGKLTEALDQIINEYTTAHPNLFTVVSLEKNVGLGLALNEGLKVCRNELVARMDTDDISLLERCELQVKEFIKNEKLCIVGTMIDEFIDDPNTIISSRIVPTTHEEILKFSRRRNPFSHPSVMYRKSKVLEVGGYKDYRRNQDMELFVTLINKGCISMNIDKSLLLFRANEDHARRRKSWSKCSSNVTILYKFWRKGYSAFNDFLFVLISQIVIFISPVWFVEWLSKKYLRKTV
jgi:glycosyltransferase involved in cell wall biosynthesis